MSLSRPCGKRKEKEELFQPKRGGRNKPLSGILTATSEQAVEVSLLLLLLREEEHLQKSKTASDK